MSTTFKFGTATGPTTLTAGTDLNGLAAGSLAFCTNVLDNTVVRNTHATFELNLEFAANPAAGGYIQLILVPTQDGTNYPDTTTPPLVYYVWAANVNANSNDQFFVAVNLPIGPHKYKVGVSNNASQALESSGNTVKVETFGLIGA